MARSPLFGRRIHIAGSTSRNTAVATPYDVQSVRELVKGLVIDLIGRGATFVIPVDAEKLREGDDLPICFDWLIWKTLYDSLALRPSGAPNPLAIAVQHHKNEEQIPPEFEQLWDDLRASDLVHIENVSHWNMNSKRMEAQARWGDILIALGGSDGVLFLANLYHDAGKPVVPLNSRITSPDTGALRLFSSGLDSMQAQRLFQTIHHSAHTWINRINFESRKSVSDRVSTVTDLLENLDKPRAFAVRLLDPKCEDYNDVESFFEDVVRPVVEDELGYKLVVINGSHLYKHPRIDQEIFEVLHRSRFVLADITGMRPNCLIELGYAFGRGLQTMLMVKEGTKHPFDIASFGALHWKPNENLESQKQAFREHWDKIQNRPPLVPEQSLIR